MLPRPFYSILHVLLAAPAFVLPLGMFLWILADGPCAWYPASCDVVYHVHLVIFGVPVIALSILWLGFVNGRVVDRSPWVRLERGHLLAHRVGHHPRTCEVCGWDYDAAAGGHAPCPGRPVPVRVSRRTRSWFLAEERRADAMSRRT